MLLCAQPLPTLWDPMDCSPPGSSVRVIFQARILKRVAISYSRRSSWTRDQKGFSCALTDGYFYHSTTWKASYSSTNLLKNSSLIWNCSNQRKETNEFLFHINFFSKEDKIQSDISLFFSFSYCLLLVKPFLIPITKKSNSHYSISSSMSLHLILPSNTVTIVIFVFVGLCSYPNYKELSLIILYIIIWVSFTTPWDFQRLSGF